MRKKTFIVVVITILLITCASCAKKPVVSEEIPVQTEEESSTDVSEVKEETITQAKKEILSVPVSKEESSEEEAEEETEDESLEDVEIPEDRYRCLTTINAFGSWAVSDTYDDFFAVTYSDDGKKVTVDNYLQQGEDKGLLETFTLTEKDPEHEKTVRELLTGKKEGPLEIESYKNGDKYIDILPGSGLIIREVANDGFMFYERDGYDRSLVANCERTVVVPTDSYSTTPFTEEESESAAQVPIPASAN